MRVCLVTSAPFPPREGLGYHVWGLAQQLIRRDHEVEIITRRQAGESCEQRVGRLTVRRAFYLPAYPFHVHLHGFAVDRAIRRSDRRFDVVNAHSPLPPAVSGGLPLVTTVHSPMAHDTAATRRRDIGGVAIRLQTPISRRIERSLFSQSRQITAVAKWIPQALRTYGIDADRVAVTGNAVEDGFLEGPRGQHRGGFALYVGRLEASKGLLDLVEAASLLEQSRRCRGLSFVLAGEGHLRPKLEERVVQHGLVKRFRFVGQVSDRKELLRLYRDATLFILPSLHEGLPTVLLEAMASELPVVATACTGCSELIRYEENGLLVEPGDAAGLAAAMQELWTDEPLRERLGRNGRGTVLAAYTWDAVVDRYLKCYASALDAVG